MAVVHDLQKFLQYLDRGDVTEIVFQSGAAATAKKRGKMKPVTREPLSAKHILKLVSDTPLEQLVPAEDGASEPTPAEIDGINYVVTIARSGDLLMLRVRREGRSTEHPPSDPEDAAVRAAPAVKMPPSAPPRRDLEPAPPVGRAVERAPVTSRAHAVPMPAAPVQAAPAHAAPAHAAPVHAAPAHAAPAAPKAPIVHHAQPRLSFRPAPEESPLGEFVRADIPMEAPQELRALLAKARAESASDVHIMAEQPVRFRCNGRLEAVGEPMSSERVSDLLMPLLNARNAKQLSELGYADFACPIEGAGRLRVNVNKQRTGLKGCFRLIMSEPPALETLGLPHELRQMLNYHQGLVVVSGPNGAGKTTTLAALVDLFNSERSVHIITVEDPVEVMHPIKKAIVSQREVGSHTKSFHAALKGSLREDPDVIAIGELRDRETVEKALEAAETGHLVFATMSTPSGASTIDRLIDMFPPDDQSQVRATLAGALKFVVSQRLVPRKDGHGEVVVVELLTGGMALWTLIRDDKLYQLPSLLQRGRGFGMIRIEDSLNDLLASETISMETAKLYADDPRALGDSHAGNAPPQASPERGGKGGMRNLISKKGR